MYGLKHEATKNFKIIHFQTGNYILQGIEFNKKSFK